MINLRGANGSGKSHLVRQWMQRQGAVPYPRRANLLGGTTLSSRPVYYRLGDGGVVLGPYHTSCGGCDNFETVSDVQKALQAALHQNPRYVLFEGVIISTVFETWRVFSQGIGGMHWLFLNTPVEICIARIRERNHGRYFDQQLVRDKIRGVDCTRVRALKAGESVLTLDWEHALPQFTRFMDRLFNPPTGR